MKNGRKNNKILKIFVQGYGKTFTWHKMRGTRDRRYYENRDKQPKGTILYKGTIEIAEEKNEIKTTALVEKWMEENNFSKAFKDKVKL